MKVCEARAKEFPPPRFPVFPGFIKGARPFSESSGFELFEFLLKGICHIQAAEGQHASSALASQNLRSCKTKASASPFRQLRVEAIREEAVLQGLKESRERQTRVESEGK